MNFEILIFSDYSSSKYRESRHRTILRLEEVSAGLQITEMRRVSDLSSRKHCKSRRRKKL
jgi:hypothetical protein